MSITKIEGVGVIRHIIENGLKQQELKNFPKWEEGTRTHLLYVQKLNALGSQRGGKRNEFDD